MKKVLFLFALLSSLFTSAQKLEKIWVTPETLDTPESVFYFDTENALFVACMGKKQEANDGDGSIAKVNPDGSIVNPTWISGLNDPKGMAVHQNKLFVADRTQLVVIDITKGSILKKYDAENSKFLNDVTVGADGEVYVSDMRDQRIYKLENNQFESWMHGADLENVNGLWAEDGKLYAGNASIWEIDLKSQQMKKLVENTEGVDGLKYLGNGKFIFSNWKGRVCITEGTKVTEILNTTDPRRNSADIDFDKTTSTLYVPTFFSNTVDAYKLHWLLETIQNDQTR